MNSQATVAGLYRYPVKSMLGEELDAAALGTDGIAGDRAWGVRDEQRGDFFVGKRAAALMGCSAWYPDARAAAAAVPRIRLPDGRDFSAADPAAAARVGELVGREVTLWPVVPEARQAQPRDGRTLAEEMPDMMARAPGEPMPDFSSPAPALLEVYARGGPFFDAFPILLLSRRSLASLAAAAPESRMDVRRFRPNLLIETQAPGSFPEQAWIGRRLRVGGAVLAIQSECVRCVMTTHGFADLPKDPTVMRTLVREAGGNLGVYATVETPGEVRRGASIALVDPE